MLDLFEVFVIGFWPRHIPGRCTLWGEHHGLCSKTHTWYLGPERGCLALSLVRVSHSDLSNKRKCKIIKQIEKFEIFSTFLHYRNKNYSSTVLYLLYCISHMVNRLTRSGTLLHMPICNAVCELHVLQVNYLWWMDPQILLDLCQCHLQCRTTALVVLLLQLLNGAVYQLSARITLG